jgi:hypothetical protein
VATESVEIARGLNPRQVGLPGRRAAFVALCGLLLAAVSGHVWGLTETAHAAAEVDTQTARLDRIQAARDPAMVSTVYVEEAPYPICGTPLLVQALAAAQDAPPAYAGRLAKILARLDTEHDVLSPSGHFRIHYDLTGGGAVDATDADGNRVPDYVDEVGRTLDESWDVEINLLGYQAPPSDGNLGGGPEYDVYLTDLAPARFCGLTYPEVGGRTTHSYIQLDNNYTDAVYWYTSGIDALHYTAAHELNHALQMGYYQGADGIWWQEATATWMEDMVFPEVDNYLAFSNSFLWYPEKSLDLLTGSRETDYRIYGACLFAHFLHQRYDVAAVRQVWEEFGRAGSADMDLFDQVIRSYDSGGLASAVAEFGVWNYFTSWRHQEAYYREGSKYPSVAMRDVQVDFSTPEVAIQEVVWVDHLASTHLRLRPELHPGGIQLNLEPRGTGRWRQHLLLAAADGVQVLPLDQGVQYVAAWDRYEEVVLVLTQVDPTGLAYEYATTITYDPDLVDAPAPSLSDVTLWPAEGGTGTSFDFTVTYVSPSNAAPEYARLVLVRPDPPAGEDPQAWLPMTTTDESYADGSVYTCSQTLPAGTYRYYLEFKAGDAVLRTDVVTGPVVQTEASPFEVSGLVTVAGQSDNSGTTIAFARRTGIGAIPAAARTNSTGAWSASGFETGTAYLATPYRPGRIFAPASADFAAATGALNFTADRATDVTLVEGRGPHGFALHPNAPNPFNAETAIRFDLGEASAIRLALYDSSGRLARVLVDGSLAAGTHTITWDATGSDGEALSSGVYLVRLAAGSSVSVRKALLVR